MVDKKTVIRFIGESWEQVPDHDRSDALYNIRDEIPDSFVHWYTLNEDDWHVMGFHDGKIRVIDYDVGGTVVDKDIDVPLDELSVRTLKDILSVLRLYMGQSDEGECEIDEPEGRDRAEWGPSAFGDPDAPRPL